MALVSDSISVFLDAELIEELKAADDDLAEQLNDAVRQVLMKRRRQRALTEFLDELTTRYGPVPPELVDKFEKLLR